MNVDATMFQQAFFDEAVEVLDELESQLLHLEERKSDRDLLNTIFRCAHSIKGGSATFGLPRLANFTHGLETLLDQVRSGKVAVTGELCQVLFRSLDHMRLLLSEATGKTSNVPDAVELSERIDALGQTSGPDGGVPTSSDADETSVQSEQRYVLRFAPGRGVMRFGSDPCLLLDQLHDIATVLDCVRDTSDLPPLSDLDPEAAYVAWNVTLLTSETPDVILELFDFVADESELVLTPIEPVSTIEDDLVEADTAIVALQRPGDAPKKSESATLRVPAEKVDRLVNLVGELVITQSMLQEATQGIEVETHPRLFEAVAALERASRELQERIMGIRLVQLKQAFGRFPRLVRDLSASVGKKIDLIMIGEETELDKTLIEGLGDPLTHLVRNAIDHGLETPDVRRASGKPETGSIKIHARYEGGNVVVEVSDDGKGLDRARILAKARERGVCPADETPSDDVIDSFIFEPGFSTAAAVTDLSGRGVGMDIVRSTLQDMNGSISMKSTPGQGTTFRIRLPLTMAIMEGLSLRIGSEVYILPLTSIIESLRPLPEDLSLVAGQHEVVRVRDEVLKIVRLHEAFGADTAVTDPCRGLLVIVESEGQKVALLVDELITQNQAVIKSLEANYRKVTGLTGATILGDGTVALIIDVPGLIRGTYREPAAATRAA